MNTGEQNTMEIENQLCVAGFWKRLLAIFIDFLLLGVFGYVLGLIFSDYFSSIGAWGRALGFVIALVYFGFQNSALFGGQTIGKRIGKLKVVAIDGRNLGLAKSLLRATILCLPIFLNGAAFDAETLQSWVAYIVSMLIFGVGISIVYLYIFNRKTRQSLHDLVVGSIVIEADSIEADPFTKVPWRGHYAVSALIIVAACLLPAFTGKLVHREPWSSLLPLQKALANELNANSVSVSAGTTWLKSTNNGSQTSKYLSANVWTKNKNANFPSMENRIVEIIFARYPNALENDIISISITNGYDIGIASSWFTKNFSYSPTAWQQRITNKSEVGTATTQTNK